MTNYERIKNSSVEEMAERLLQMSDCRSCPCTCGDGSVVFGQSCWLTWVDWLNEEATDD